MNKCDKSENQLFDSMIRFIKNGVLLVRYTLLYLIYL